MGSLASKSVPQWVQCELIDQAHEFRPLTSQPEWNQEGVFVGLRDRHSMIVLLSPDIHKNNFAVSSNAMCLLAPYKSKYLALATLDQKKKVMQEPDVLPELKQLQGHKFRVWMNKTTSKQALFLFDEIQAWILVSRIDKSIPISEAKDIDDLNKKRTCMRVDCNFTRNYFEAESKYYHEWSRFLNLINTNEKFKRFDSGVLQYISRSNENPNEWFIVAKKNTFGTHLEGCLKTATKLRFNQSQLQLNYCSLAEVLDSRLIPELSPSTGDVCFSIYTFESKNHGVGVALYLFDSPNKSFFDLQSPDTKCYVFQSVSNAPNVFKWDGRNLSVENTGIGGLAPLPHECESLI